MPKLKLKPCPFCGGEAEVLDLSYPINMPPWEVRGYGVVCPCGASVRMFDKKTEAAKAWNRRVDNGSL